MGLHAAVFSPAKYGIVPEMVPDRDLSRANAVLEMTTFVSIVLGIASGGILVAVFKGAAWRMGLVTLGIAVCGFVCSLGIARVPAAGAPQRFGWNPFAGIEASTRRLVKDRALWLTVLGTAWFWFAGVLLKTDLQYFGTEVLHAGDDGVSLLWAVLAIGIGVGNILAGRLSGDKVELGLVPLGAAMMGVFTLALVAARHSFAASAVMVALLAMSSGLFVVPLYAFLQQRSGAQEKGSVLAATNFYQTVGMLVASAVMSLGYTRLHLGSEQILVGFAIAMFGVTAYILTIVPDFFVRFVLWMLTHTVYRIRIRGQENVPFHGPALLVANHVSFIDGLLVGACVQRFIRFMVWKPYYEHRAFHWLLSRMYAIPVGLSGPRDMVESIRAARKQLAEGHLVCIFAEGAISRTGNLLPFRRGLEKIVQGTDVPVIPVHLDGVWGSIFSFEGGRFFWKRPKRVPYPVTVSFGAPLPSTTPTHAVRQAIQELAAEAAAERKSPADTLRRRLYRSARRNWNRFCMADSTGRSLTFGQLLTGARLLRIPAREEMVGVLLPPTVAGALVNVSLTLDGKVPVNLNFTAGREAVRHAIAQCGIGTVVTSRAFMARVGAQVGDLSGVVYVEDLLANAGTWAKLRALISARLLPAPRHGGPDSLAAVIFSSGSSGDPKGVMLSHYNLISGIEAIAGLFPLDSNDRIAGVLPFFHSFGFTVTIWFPLLTGCGAVYHPNPMDAGAIGELVRKHRATLLLSTPTFCSTYVRKCTPEQFASLRYVLVGAEKLRHPVAAAFREKFGLDLLEGYGCTEMSPVVAVNAPGYEAGPDSQPAAKAGTVGHPLPGVAARIVDPVTFAPLPPDTEGLLLVKGSNRMLGYLHQPARTADVVQDGWYITGDIAVLDHDGFLRITDRLSRFSKIAGEMVPHLKIEEAILEAMGDGACAVTGVPDEQRGERLVALYTQTSIAPVELWQRLADTDLPRLWLPKREHLYPVESLPQLGTGKLDLRGVKALAESLSGVCARL
jgi:acyl-[acyl-carrier-protein]-phospholipid O-acyltransferase/long-chain-fatty-acid--[acyl-carrier-protein] ligase